MRTVLDGTAGWSGRAGGPGLRPPGLNQNSAARPEGNDLLPQRQAAVPQERVRPVWGAPDPPDATLGHRGDLLQGVAGQVGQLHPLEAGPQAARPGSARAHRRPAAPPPARTAGDPATPASGDCGGRAAHPTPASPSARQAPGAAAPRRRSACRCRRRLAGGGRPVGRRRRGIHRTARPPWRPAATCTDGGSPGCGRPAPRSGGQPAAATRRPRPKHDGGPTTPRVAADLRASPRPPSGQWPPRRARPRGGPGAAGGSAAGGVAASTRVRGGANPRQLLDHRRDARQGPVVGVEAVRAGALPQRLVDGGKLLVGQARACPVGPALRSAGRPPWRQRACQRLTSWRATPSWRATWAWEWPVVNSAPACMRTCSNAWRSHRPRALRR
jgi:hypothetical protein